MEQDPSLSWSDIPTHGEDEFTNFLEFGMPFPDLEGHGPTDNLPGRTIAHQVSMPTTTAPTQEQLVCMDADNTTAGSSSYTRIMSDFSVDISGQQVMPHGSSYSSAPMTPAFYAQKSQAFSNPNPQQQHHQQQHNTSHHVQPTSQPYIPQGQMMIPPTPNSIELQGSAATYSQRIDDNHDMYSHEQALYTPLISPAMTPLESQFRVSEYTIPGEYFTPLTSPAIEAQNANSNNYPFHTGQVTDMGFVPSPIDSSIPVSSAPASPGLVRKHRRRLSTTAKIQRQIKKQQSPLIRPGAKSRLTDEVLNSLSQDQSNSRPTNGSGLRYGSNDSSGQDSVSPEPLSEPLMPPPALPPSRKSPTINPQNNHSNAAAPATPAMLMRIQRSPHTRSTANQIMAQTQPPTSESISEIHDDIMEDVVLPEAATPSTQLFQPQVVRIDTAVSTTAPSPSISAHATSYPEPKSASLDRNPSSIAPSPRSGPMPSPSGPVGRKSETPKLGPMNRKRQSLSSSHPSPSLRPKISPDIRPRTYGEGLSSDTSALFLASKSNYQHILDGTLPQGVSYPETLAENLSSKRTNHKLAEQGRRNRINKALKEIEDLIPAAFVHMKNNKDSTTCNGKGGEKEKDKAGNQPISKATTVEMAIDYIKSLKMELEETKTKLAAAQAKLSNSDNAQQNSEAMANSSPTSCEPTTNGLEKSSPAATLET